LRAVHEQHRVNTAAHVAKLASDAEKMARLQGIGSVPPLGVMFEGNRTPHGSFNWTAEK
jgi:hypothetical protein